MTLAQLQSLDAGSWFGPEYAGIHTTFVINLRQDFFNTLQENGFLHYWNFWNGLH